MNETPENPEGESQAGDFFKAAWLFYLILAVAGVIWLGLHRGDIELAAFFGRATWPRDAGLGLLSGAFLIGSWEGGRRIFPAMAELESLIGAAIGPIERGQVLVLALLSGFAEELFFRGAVLSSWGPVIATLLFALVHSGPGKAFRWWTLFALFAGGLFAGLTVFTGNLLAAIVGHVLVNSVNLWRLTEDKTDSPDPSQKL